MNRSAINGVVLGAGKNASFALLAVAQAHELVTVTRMTVGKYLSAVQSHTLDGPARICAKVAMNARPTHEMTASGTLHALRPVRLAAVSRHEGMGTASMRLRRIFRAQQTHELTATAPMTVLHQLWMAATQTHELTTALTLFNFYTGPAPLERVSAVLPSVRYCAVAGTTRSAGA